MDPSSSSTQPPAGGPFQFGLPYGMPPADLFSVMQQQQQQQSLSAGANAVEPISAWQAKGPKRTREQMKETQDNDKNDDDNNSRSKKASKKSSLPAAKDGNDSQSQISAALARATTMPEQTLRSKEDDEKAWRAAIQNLPRCCAAEGIRETSVFQQQTSGRAAAGNGGGGRKGCLKKLLLELASLEEQDTLPTYPAIWLRFDEETPQFLRALITGPEGTPYAHGLFCFDIFVPDQYPNCPPQVKLLTTGGGTVAFSPNLYANGTVCLSLLGTWSGPKWNALHSSLMQVLVSIQGLILGVDHPYYLEPGHGGWGEKKTIPSLFGPSAAGAQPLPFGHSAGAQPLPFGHSAGAQPLPPTTQAAAAAAAAGFSFGPFAGPADPAPNAAGTTGTGTDNNAKVKEVTNVPNHVKVTEDSYREGTAKFALLDMYRTSMKHASSSNPQQYQQEKPRGGRRCPHYLDPFQDIIKVHFAHYRISILQEVKSWASIATRRTTKMQMEQAVQALTAEFAKHCNDKGAEAKMTKAKAASAKDDDEGGGTSSETEKQEAKQKAMEEAANKGDYILAAKYQRKLQFLQGKDTIGGLIDSKRQRMEEAAQKKDYILAGNIQQSLKHLETFHKRLHDLQRRMFDSATQEDFVRAGHFQEQYQILMEDLTVEDASAGSSSLGAAAGGGNMGLSTNGGPPAAMMWDQSGAGAAAAGFKGFAPHPMYPPYYDDGYDDYDY